MRAKVVGYLSILLMVFLSFSCEEKVDLPSELGDVPNKGGIVIDDESYELSQVDLFLEYEDSVDNDKAWRMMCYSEGIELHQRVGRSYPDSLSGNGHLMQVYLFMNSPDDIIATGTYNGMPAVEGFQLYANKDFDNNTSGSYYLSNIMSFTFEKTNKDEMTFTFNGDSENPAGKFISGNYQGSYRVFDATQ